LQKVAVEQKRKNVLNRRSFLKASATGAFLLAVHPMSAHAEAEPKGKEEVIMAYEPKDFKQLLGMEGFSDTLLNNHFTLYNGYVTNTNKNLELSQQLLKEGNTYAFGEVKRRLGWEFNGIRLHELYFGNLGGKAPLKKDGKLAKKLAENFGSYEAWEKDFREVGAMRGIGWAVLYQDNTNGRLINFWINEHDCGHPAGCIPILIMDVFEHAYMIDYGVKKAGYIDAFFKNVNWDAAEKRLK
jgi:Fe-Mn family superoxide dismutase